MTIGADGDCYRKTVEHLSDFLIRSTPGAAKTTVPMTMAYLVCAAA